MKNFLLIGKWEFIAAELYRNSKWQPSQDWVKEMQWEFEPQFFSTSNVIGSITESCPKEDPIALNYSYNQTEKILKIEIFTDPVEGMHDQSQADIYEVIFSEPQSEEMPTIILNILNSEGNPAPYFRYILRKVE